jgi:hypothetical protein
MVWKLFSFDQWLDAYFKAGLRIIPIEGKQYPDGTWDPKSPGYMGWETYVATRAQLVMHISNKYRWSMVCGPASGGMMVLDYDLQKEFGSTEEARAWRNSHVWALRDMETPVVFSPSGGCHVWVRCPGGMPKLGSIERLTYGVFPCDPDLVKYDGGHVLIPPSRLIDKGYYLFMDQDEVVPNLSQKIRVIK